MAVFKSEERFVTGELGIRTFLGNLVGRRRHIRTGDTRMFKERGHRNCKKFEVFVQIYSAIDNVWRKGDRSRRVLPGVCNTRKETMFGDTWARIEWEPGYLTVNERKRDPRVCAIRERK